MYLLFKRWADFLVSLAVLIVISPILLIVMLILKCSGEGEVFYNQKRIGYHDKPFGIMKFATMLKNSPNIGHKTVTLRDDPRITTIGKYLRITKLNEIPQILNVLKGDMSFVGPRPLLDTSVAKYAQSVQDILYKNRPGITGLGSIVFRDEEKLVSEISLRGADPMQYYRQHIYPYKGQLETYYYQNMSFLTDLKILIATAWQIIFKQSMVVYTFFPDLPHLPVELTVKGIQEMDISLLQ